MKYKLAPIEPDNESVWNAMQLQKHRNTCPSPRDSYKTMLANCETVEVVDVDKFYLNEQVGGAAFAKFIRDVDHAASYNKAFDYLKENGYMIVRKA